MIIEYILIILIISVVYYYIHGKKIDDEPYLPPVLTVVLETNNNNRSEENKPDDDLPPYTPPTPKTQAAMADLPPSYDEIIINNDDVNIPMVYNINPNNNNLPATFVNPDIYTVPEIVINPIDASASVE